MLFYFVSDVRSVIRAFQYPGLFDSSDIFYPAGVPAPLVEPQIPRLQEARSPRYTGSSVSPGSRHAMGFFFRRLQLRKDPRILPGYAPEVRRCCEGGSAV